MFFSSSRFPDNKSFCDADRYIKVPFICFAVILQSLVCLIWHEKKKILSTSTTTRFRRMSLFFWLKIYFTVSIYQLLSCVCSYMYEKKLETGLIRVKAYKKFCLFFIKNVDLSIWTPGDSTSIMVLSPLNWEKNKRLLANAGLLKNCVHGKWSSHGYIFLPLHPG